ncbi:MAG: XdhC family protein [Alphaproteobacteria bacterium]|nr:MAG: XdhC family protein [Alphaproteobacteria bacterium]
MSRSDDQVIEQALRWIESGHQVALATVIHTWGSAPRPAGSQLAVCDDMTFVGSVSGGCVENAVIHAAIDAIKSGAAQTLDFGVSDTDAWEVGLACGGQIRIYVEPVRP